MKKRMIIAAAMAMMLLAMTAAPAFAVTYGTVHGGWLRLRADPSYSATVITSYKNGTVVTVLSQENGWAKVLTADYRVGYMDARYLYIGESPAPAPTIAPATRTWTDVNRTAFVTSANGKGVRLRSSPVVNNSNVLGLYPVGRTVTEIRKSSDGWSYIKIDKKHGYMMSKYLTSNAIITPPPAPPAWPTAMPTITPTPNPANPTATPMPTITPTPAPTNTPAPTAETVPLEYVGLNPIAPKSGDTITLRVKPEGVDYSAVWYLDNNTYLGTGKSYKVKDSDVGHRINVRVMGAGVSAGTAVDGITDAVSATPAPDSEP